MEQGFHYSMQNLDLKYNNLNPIWTENHLGMNLSLISTATNRTHNNELVETKRV
jgi:hypothetical protein